MKVLRKIARELIRQSRSASPNLHTKGLTLIEVVIAIGLFGLMASALVTVVGQTKSVTTSSELRNKASRYAEEAMEIVRRTRDEKKDNWYDFLAMACPNTGEIDGGCYSLDNGSLRRNYETTDYQGRTVIDCNSQANDSNGSDFLCGQNIAGTPFMRYIYFYNDPSVTDYGTSKVKVTVVVSWMEKGREEKIKQESFLTGW